MTRRQALATIAGTVVAGCSGRRAAPVSQPAEVTFSSLPRWRGFNLLEMFQSQRPVWNTSYLESDFETVRELGFDFVRLPMDYRCWTDPKQPDAYDEKVLRRVDQAVAWGQSHGVHVCLNLHRAPGYCINDNLAEELDLWTSPEAQRQFEAQWRAMATRYKGINSRQLSFNLVNEPRQYRLSTAEQNLLRRVVSAVHQVDPGRLVVLDGIGSGALPCLDLADCPAAQSYHGYQPMDVTHAGANWIGNMKLDPPSWPLVRQDGSVFDREALSQSVFGPWRELARRGVGVTVGEFGVYTKTPHDIALRYLQDLLGLVRAEGWGWAMWNLRGSFGILDSQRGDVAYETYKGSKLDRRMLEVLREDGRS